MTGFDDAEKLWSPRSVEETQALYAKWASSYDDDTTNMGYATPARVALALRRAGANPSKPILDFGCGTGLSGMALRALGFDLIDGTDISPEMLEIAQTKDAYRQVWLGQPGSMGHVKRGDYTTIAATGVVSLGAAPPETLDLLVNAIAPGGMLAFSYNGATLEDASYMGKLAEVLAADDTELAFEENGPHLPGKDMKSTVYVILKT